MSKQCAWCFPPGHKDHDATASHGICGRHEVELLIENPLLGIIGRLRGPEYLGTDARERIAHQLETAIHRAHVIADHIEPGARRAGQGTEGRTRQPQDLGTPGEVPPAAAPSHPSTDRPQGVA